MSSLTRSPSPPHDSHYYSGDGDPYSSDDEYDKDLSPNLLWSFARCGLSVESAVLKIDRDRHIYGDIHLNEGSHGKAYAVYHRKSDEPEFVSSASGGGLTLCGPRNFLWAAGRPPTILYDEGGSPFLQQRHRLDLSSLETNQSIPVSVIGDKGTLTLNVTWVSPSVLTRVFVDLVNANEQEKWKVSGTISAIQMLPGGHNRRVFNIFQGNSLPLSDVPIVHLGPPFSMPAQAITLDRCVILAPVHLEDSIVKMANELIASHGSTCKSPFVDPPNLNGLGSSLSFDVDLKFVDAADDNIHCFIKDVITFELKGSHMLGEPFFQYMEGVIKPHKRKLDSVIGSTKGSPSDDKLKIRVMIDTFTDIIIDIPDELFEYELALYTGPSTP